MKSRKRVLGAVVTLISLPLVVALVEAVSFHVRNRNNGSIVSSGEKREYLLYVPKSYDATRPTPLVISMHGGGGWPAMQRDLSEWNRLAESHGFIVVYPSGLKDGGVRGWRVIRRGTGLTKDVRFISDLIDDLEKAYNIDPARIYADGLSNGGGMAFVLSCTLSDRIAAVGMVAAAQMLPWSWCTDHRPVPMISFHGTDDPVVPYEGGTSWVWDGSFPDVSEWAANWALRNRCGPDTVESAVAADVTRRDYTDCADDAAVVLFKIHDGGHTWPGGKPLPEWFVGPTSREIDASFLMWEFFQKHRLGTDGNVEIPDRRATGEGGPQPARSPKYKCATHNRALAPSLQCNNVERGTRAARDASVHQRSNHTGEHCGSRRNHRRGGVYPRPFWHPGAHTAGLPERRRYP